MIFGLGFSNEHNWDTIMTKKYGLLLLNYFGPACNAGYYQYDKTCEILDSFIIAFKANQLPVISVSDRFQGPDFNAYACPYTLLDDVKHFGKNRISALEEPAVLSFIREQNLDRLILGGFSTEKSIAATIHTALNNGFPAELTLLAEGHSTGESGDVAERIIEKHNAWWYEADNNHEKFSLQYGGMLIDNF